MNTNKTIALSTLPPVFLAHEDELLLMRKLIKYTQFFSQPFHAKELEEVALAKFETKTDYQDAFFGLLRLGVIYQIKSANDDHKQQNQSEKYFVHAEKVIQALINKYPEDVIGRRLFKFESDSEILDGGFINNDSEIFDATMTKLAAIYGKRRDDKSLYLPNFIRSYECIGTIDGQDFFKNPLSHNITSKESREQSNTFVIPKYATIEKNNIGESLANTSKVCVCIS